MGGLDLLDGEIAGERDLVVAVVLLGIGHGDAQDRLLLDRDDSDIVDPGLQAADRFETVQQLGIGCGGLMRWS